MADRLPRGSVPYLRGPLTTDVADAGMAEMAEKFRETGGQIYVDAKA